MTNINQTINIINTFIELSFRLNISSSLFIFNNSKINDFTPFIIMDNISIFSLFKHSLVKEIYYYLFSSTIII